MISSWTLDGAIIQCKVRFMVRVCVSYGKFHSFDVDVVLATPSLVVYGFTLRLIAPSFALVTWNVGWEGCWTVLFPDCRCRRAYAGHRGCCEPWLAPWYATDCTVSVTVPPPRPGFLTWKRPPRLSHLWAAPQRQSPPIAGSNALLLAGSSTRRGSEMLLLVDEAAPHS